MRPWGRPVLLWPNLRYCSFQQVQARTPALWLGAALWRDWGEPLMTLLYHWSSGPRHHLALSSSSQLPALFLFGRGVEIRNRRKGGELQLENSSAKVIWWLELALKFSDFQVLKFWSFNHTIRVHINFLCSFLKLGSKNPPKSLNNFVL